MTPKGGSWPQHVGGSCEIDTRTLNAWMGPREDEDDDHDCPGQMDGTDRLLVGEPPVGQACRRLLPVDEVLVKGCQNTMTVTRVVHGIVQPVPSRSKTTAASAALPM